MGFAGAIGCSLGRFAKQAVWEYRLAHIMR
jgi:hypothetical protein